MSIVPANDSLRARQSQAGARTGRLSRKEGIEDAASIFLRNSPPSVGDRNEDRLRRNVLGRPCIAGYKSGAKRQFSSFGHGIQGIQNKVDEYLFKSRGIALHGRQVK